MRLTRLQQEALRTAPFLRPTEVNFGHGNCLAYVSAGKRNYSSQVRALRGKRLVRYYQPQRYLHPAWHYLVWTPEGAARLGVVVW